MSIFENPRQLLKKLEAQAAVRERARKSGCSIENMHVHMGPHALRLDGEAIDSDALATFKVSIDADGDEAGHHCSCNFDGVCSHALQLARHWARHRYTHQSSGQSRWRKLIERLAPFKKPPLPPPGHEAFVHWLQPCRLESGGWGLEIRWKLHKPGPKSIGRGKVVKPAEAASPGFAAVTPLDRRVIEAAIGTTIVKAAKRGELKATIIRPEPTDLDAVFRALAQAPYVYWENGRRVSFDPLAAIPKIMVRETGERVNLSVEWTLADNRAWVPAEPRIFAGPGPWIEDGWVLRPIYGVADGQALEELMDEGAWVSAAEVGSFLGTAMPALHSWGARTSVEVSPGRNFIADLECMPRLYLEEDARKLSVVLRFGYGEIEVGDDNPQPVLMIDVGAEPVCIQRDLEAEFEAVGELREVGLVQVEPGRFEASGDDALEFLLTHLPVLAERWQIFGRNSIVRHRVSRNQLTMNVAVKSGVDWLEVNAEAKSDGDPVEIERILKALKKGSRFVRLSDGAHGIIPDKWRAGMVGLLEQLGVGSEPEKSSLFMAPVADELARFADEVITDDGEDWRDYLIKLLDGSAATERELPQGIDCELRPYQERGYQWLGFLDVAGVGGILADDMGLGKTIQALTLLSWEKHNTSNGPSLVIAPTSVVPNWDNETKRHAPGLTPLRYHGADRGKILDSLEGADVVITSYAITRRDIEQLEKIDWNYVILDEAQAIKNAATATARAVKRLKARRRLALTGTPLENHLGELWSHFNFLNPGLLGSQKQFAEKFERPIHKGDEHAVELLKGRIAPFILRRMKSEVAPELPPKIENILGSEFNPAQEQLYNSLLDAGREKVRRAIEEKGVGGARTSILEVLLRLRQTCCHPQVLPGGLGDGIGSAKFDQFCDFVTEVVEEGNRVLVYSQFVKVLKIMKNWFEEAGINHLYMDGSTRNREKLVNRFQTDASVSSFLVSLKAGGTGLNLTAADYVIIYDPWWNPSVEAQATDRAHRIGRVNTVFAYRMVARNSVEEKIQLLKEKKMELTDKFITSQAGGGGIPLAEDQIMSLFDR